MTGWWRRHGARGKRLPRLIVVAPRLSTMAGHFVNELLGHRKAAAELGMTIRVLVPRNAPAELVEAVNGEPVLDDVPRHRPLGPETAVRRISKFADGMASLEFVWRALERDPLGESDLILFVRALAPWIGAVGKWLSSRPGEDRPAIFFRFVGREISDPDGDIDTENAVFYRLASEQLRGSPGDERVFFLSESRRAIRTINRVCRRRAFLMPLPKHLRHGAGDISLPDNTEPLLVYAHFNIRARDMLPVFSEVVRMMKPHSPELRYLVKCASLDRGGIGDDVLPLIEILPDEQDPDAFFENYRRSSIVLLGFGPAGYRDGTSGVFIEAAAFGRPVVAAAGTWMAEQMSRGIGVGTLFNEPTAVDIAAALSRLLADATANIAAAQAGAAAVRAEHSCYRYVERMLTLAAEPVDMRAVYDLGHEIVVGDLFDSRLFLGKGWRESESRGVWTDAAEATLSFLLPDRPRAPLMLRVLARAFLDPAHPRLRVLVRMGDRILAEWLFDDEDRKRHGPRWHEAAIPQNVDREIMISLVIDRPAASAPAGISDNARWLGLGLSRLIIIEAPAAVTASVPT